jgi:hypothetical protein
MATKNINPDAIESGWDEKEKQPVKQTNKFDEKNYLNVRLDTARGELTKEIKIRVLPIDCDTNNPFQKIHMHYVKVDKKISQNGFKNYICLKETSGIDSERFGNKCPFCEAKDDAWKHFNESTEKAEKDKWVQVAHENTPNEYAIIRCIERGHEEDGVKFWLFASSPKKKDGVLDKIMTIANQRAASAAKKGNKYSIFDLNNGMDLILTLTKTADGKTNIQVLDEGMPSPLSENFEQGMQWINDSKKWDEVYTLKSFDYMSIVSKGGVPVFNKEVGKYISKEEDEKIKQEAESEKAAEAEKPKKDFSEITEKQEAVVIHNGDNFKTEEDDSLPF